MARETARLRVEGRVQGVGYRFWAMSEARRLGLDGWVRNRSDGSVEILVTGKPEAVAALQAACGRGPPASTVSDVRREPSEDDGTRGFVERPTA